MNGGRYTIVLAVLLGSLAAYFYFFEFGVEQEAGSEKLFGIDAEEIDLIKVTTGDTRTTIEKSPTKAWDITTPVRYPADPTAVGTLIREVTMLSPSRTVADSAEDLSEYGLEFPSAAVEVSKGLDKPSVLLLGDMNPTGTSFYAIQEDGRRVFLVSAQINANLRKPTDALRDPRLFRLESDSVAEIELVQGERKTVIRKDALGIWRVETPFRLPAENDAVINLINNIVKLDALTFVEEAPATLEPYGLSDPYLTATMKSANGQTTHTLALGKAIGSLMYAKTSVRPNVYAVRANLLDQLDREPGFFRRVSAFGFQSFRIPGFSIALKEESATLDKRSFEDWRMTSPYEFRADDKLITTVLDSLEVMKVREHIPATPENVELYGIADPAAQFTLTVEDRIKPLEILVGSISPDGKTRYVMDPAEEWIYAVQSTGLEKLPSTILELRDRKIMRFKGYQVHMFEVVTAERRLRVRRDQKEKTVWKMEEPISGDADAVSVGRAFSILDSLHSEALITFDSDADLSIFGLDRPVMELTMQIGGRNDIREERLSLLVGDLNDDDKGMIYVKRRDSPIVSLVKADFVPRIRKMVESTPTS